MPSIAVIGIGCRFPGAQGPEAFWRLLRDGVSAVTEVPPDRWDAAALYHADPARAGRTNSRWGGFLADADRFDAGFFGISPREAGAMDPQQRLLLEVAWEALEDGGQAVDRLAGSATGVFVGISTNDYGRLLQADPDRVDIHTNTGSALSIAANRISYALDLRGPSLAVDTACSSSLVAVHLACESLGRSESSLALAGGVNLILSPEISIGFSKLRALSPDGRCRAFDAGANGYVRSEGVGLVLLKPLEAAIADGDRIYAVIRGSAVNQDGRSNGLTAPSRWAQEAVLRDAYRRAGVTPCEVDYVEAHGSGTLLGDPIEANALGAVVGQGRPPARPCRIGSVKTNLGHTEAAAGIAGLIKVALALRYGTLPPSLHFTSPNPHIPFADLGLKVQERAETWPGGDRPCLAGVSAFGFGGTNAHVVVEEFCATPRVTAPVPPPAIDASTGSAHLLPLSARSPAALGELAETYRVFLASGALADICDSAGVRRAHHDQRLAVVGGTREALIQALEAFGSREPHPGLIVGCRSQAGPPKLAFVFPGHGAQRPGMGQALYRLEPAFRKAIDGVSTLMAPWLGQELAAWFKAGRDLRSALGVALAQPLLFALQVGLAAVWNDRGIVPDAVVGHSLGEVAASYVAGVLSLEDACRVAAVRSRLLGDLPGGGGMALVELTPQEASEAIAPFAGRLVIAACNGPAATVLAGDIAPLEELLESLDAAGVFCRQIQVEVASHSPAVDALLEPLVAELAGLRPGPAKIPMYSTVSAARVVGPELDGHYWARNLRGRVEFLAASRLLAAEGYGVAVELSPHPLLAFPLEATYREAGKELAAIPSLRKDAAEQTALLEGLAALYVRGYGVRFKPPEPAGRFVSLPRYPWQRERFWFPDTGTGTGTDADADAGTATGTKLAAAPGEPSRHEPSRRDAVRPVQPGLPVRSPGRPESAREGGWGHAEVTGHPLLGIPVDLAAPEAPRIWESELLLERLPFLEDHVIDGDVVFPGTGYLEMAIAAASQAFGPGPLSLRGVSFEQALVLRSGEPRRLQLSLTIGADGVGAFGVFSRPPGTPAWTRHARGEVQRLDSSASARSAAADSVSGRSPWEPAEFVGEDYSPELLYGRIEQAGRAVYGPTFRGLREMRRTHDQVLARVQPSPGLAEDTAYHFHPALADSCGQALLALLPEDRSGLHLLAGVTEIRVWGRPAARMWCHATATAVGASTLEGDVRLTDERGELVLEARGLRWRGLEMAARLDKWFFATEWEPRPLVATESAEPGAWLILANRESMGATVAATLKAVLEAAGHACRIEPAISDLAWLQGVVDLRTLDGSSGDPGATAHGNCLAVLTLIQGLARTPDQPGDLPDAPPQVPRLYVVTRRAQTEGCDGPSPEQAAVWGLGRVAMNEASEFRPTLIDMTHLDPAECAALATELLADDPENQVMLRGPDRLVLRLDRASLPEEPAWPGSPSPSGGGVVPERQGWYLITGGMGGIGLKLAGHLVERGARQLALLGRRSPSEQAARTIADLQAHGAEIRVVLADVADRQALEAAVAGLPGTLRGVFHAAGVLDDGALTNLTPDRLAAVLAPKVAGAWNLHGLTSDRPVDQFVLFSSAAALLGSPGQGNYAAGNAFLDALARHRRSLGLAAQAISWGPWAEVGLAARVAARAAAREAVGGSAPGSTADTAGDRGMGTLTVAEGLVALDRIMAAGGVNTCVLPVDLPRWLASYPGAARSPLMARMASAIPAARPTGQLRDELFADRPERRAGVLEQFVAAQIAAVLRLAPGRLAPDTPLQTLGLDSVMILEVRNRVEDALAMKVPATTMWAYPTARALAAHLLQRLEQRGANALHVGTAPGTSIRSHNRDSGSSGAIEPIGPTQAPGTAGILPAPTAIASGSRRDAGGPRACATGSSMNEIPSSTQSPSSPEAAESIARAAQIEQLSVAEAEALLALRLAALEKRIPR